jgi:hypothetical protein
MTAKMSVMILALCLLFLIVNFVACTEIEEFDPTNTTVSIYAIQPNYLIG